MTLPETTGALVSASRGPGSDARRLIAAARHVFELREEPHRVPPAVTAALARVPITMIPRLSGAERWEAGVAMVRSRAAAVSVEAAQAAVAAVDWEALSTHTGLSPRVRAWGWLTVAEISLSSGSLRRALSAVTNARWALAETSDPSMRRQTLTLTALVFALNGEYARARRTLDQAPSRRDLRADRFALCTRAVLAAAESDAWVLRECAGTLRRLSPRTDADEAAATLMTSLALLLDGRAEESSAQTAGVLHAADAERLPPLLHALALALAARALIARGEHLRALSLLHDQSSPAGHAVCFDAVRASAHLGVGQWREGLRATDGCLRMGHDHVPRTLTSVLLHRAVAFERLGHAEAADGMFSDGIHRTLASGSVADMLSLPPDALDTLLSRSGEATAGLARRVHEVRATMPPPQRVARTVPVFTPREEVLARALLTGAPMSQIAVDLHVSFNTIKTQTRAVYRRAGVRSRSELITLLDDLGFGGTAGT